MGRAAVLYLPAPPHAHSDQLDALARAGLDVVAIVREESGRAPAELGRALDLIAAGHASTLALVRLADGARSLHELLALSEWLESARAHLFALDTGLDTALPGAAVVTRLLRELERWERAPRPGRAPRGRPGLATEAPDLGARIAAMRTAGLSLQAIADALNADGTPTRRGGELWRPSSVQAALGYRRPRPPLPGAAHLPPAPDRAERGPRRRPPDGRGKGAP